MNRAPNNALEEFTHPQEGEEDLKNNSGDDEEDQPQYEWDDQEYKASFVHFINEEPVIDTAIRIAAGTTDKMVELVYNYCARSKTDPDHCRNTMNTEQYLYFGKLEV